jgi:hypothetical protein
MGWGMRTDYRRIFILVSYWLLVSITYLRTYCCCCAMTKRIFINSGSVYFQRLFKYVTFVKLLCKVSKIRISYSAHNLQTPLKFILPVFFKVLQY